MSRIKGYSVKKREIGLENWHHVNQYLHSATQFNITNLVEGRSCEFIILAEHDIGCILPSTISQQVVAKDPDEPQPPEIVPQLKTIAAVKEKDGKLEFVITGNPNSWCKMHQNSCSTPRAFLSCMGVIHLTCLLNTTIMSPSFTEYMTCTKGWKAGSSYSLNDRIRRSEGP